MHINGGICQTCEEKLAQAHPYLANWFRETRARYSNLHVSWSFRKEADQNAMVKAGKSKLPWPKSAHNHMAGSIPVSLALDLFQEDEDGVGRWSLPFFTKLNGENVAAGYRILWGGRWKTLGDADHFEMVD